MKKYQCVLLIDDDPICNFISFTCLTKLKITDNIQIERNGEEALEFLKKYHRDNNCLPDLILLDIIMPVMDGYEFLEEFEKLAYSSPVKPIIIIVTNLLTAKDIAFLRKKGYLRVLNKPFDKDKLLEILSQPLQA